MEKNHIQYDCNSTSDHIKYSNNFNSGKAEASVDGKLITVGGKTVTKNMKIDDVKKMFGEPN